MKAYVKLLLLDQDERGDTMQGGFTKGLLIGSIIGASISMMMEPGMMNNRTRRKMMKSGRNLIRKSGNIIGDVVELFR